MTENIKNDFQHYRSIAIGFTAPVIALSLFELQFFLGPNSCDISRLRTVGLGLLVLAILFCVTLQGLILVGYLYQARMRIKDKGILDPNRWFFGPADELVPLIFIVFLVGTTLLVPARVGGWIAFLAVILAGFVLYIPWRTCGLPFLTKIVRDGDKSDNPCSKCFLMLVWVFALVLLLYFARRLVF